MRYLHLTPADGWVDLGEVDMLTICQVDPRITSVNTPAIEALRSENDPAPGDVGVVQLGGWSLNLANFDALGLGPRLYVRAIPATVRLIVNSI